MGRGLKSLCNWEDKEQKEGILSDFQFGENLQRYCDSYYGMWCKMKLKVDLTTVGNDDTTIVEVSLDC